MTDSSSRRKTERLAAFQVTFEEYLVENLVVRITHGIDPEAA
jgi:hypothetical protein